MKHSFWTLQILNITTGCLHSKMGHIYQFFDTILGPESAVMTHELPAYRKAFMQVAGNNPAFSHLPKSGHHPDIPNPVITFEFSEADKEAFYKELQNMIEMP